MSSPLPAYYTKANIDLLKNLNKKKSIQGCTKAITRLSFSDHKFISRVLRDLMLQKGAFSIPQSQKVILHEKLKPFAASLKKFISPRVTHRARHNLLKTGELKRGSGEIRGGAIFTTLFFSLLPLAVSLISNAVSK